MSERNEQICEWLLEGVTQTEVAKRVGVSRGRIHQIAARNGIPDQRIPRVHIDCEHCGVPFPIGGRTVHIVGPAHQDFLRARRVARFWEQVHKTETCWLWTGEMHPVGYGIAGVPGRPYTHRYSYELEHGSIPSGMMVLHHCDVRRCVRPSHLYAGSGADNARDRDVRTYGRVRATLQ